MTDTYRIKPLVWQGNDNGDFYWSIVEDGEYQCILRGEAWWDWAMDRAESRDGGE